MNSENNWYASRILKNKAMILRRLGNDAVRCYSTSLLPNIQFVHCPESYARQLMSDFWGSLFFYGNHTEGTPQAIRPREMEIFMLVTSATDDLIVINNPSPEFLTGQKVRVTAGPFAGAEGVIKRIKGDRRLIVSIDGVTAVATCYIRPELLEKI